jgi:hypothetical protein
MKLGRHTSRNKKECFDFLNGFFSFFITVNWTNKFPPTNVSRSSLWRSDVFTAEDQRGRAELIECVSSQARGIFLVDGFSLRRYNKSRTTSKHPGREGRKGEERHVEWKVEGELIKLSVYDTLADGFQICAFERRRRRRKLSDKTYQFGVGESRAQKKILLSCFVLRANRKAEKIVSEMCVVC